MAYEDVVLSDYPSRLWMLDGKDKGFVDYTGLGQPATLPPTVTNYHRNPLPTSASGYGVVWGATVTYDAAKQAVKVVSSTQSSSGVSLHGNIATVQTGDVRTYSVEVEAITATTVTLSIQGAMVPGGSQNSSVTLAAGEKRTITNTVTHTAAGLPAMYVIRTSNLVEQFYVRKVMQTDTAEPVGYFDGSTTYRPVVTNLVPNPSVEVNASGWGGGANATRVRTTAKSYFGTASVLHSRINTSNGNCFTTVGSALPTTIGKKYTFSVYVYPLVDGVRVVTGFGGTSVAAPLLNQWQRVTVTHTATTASTTYFVVSDAAPLVVADHAYIDGAMVTETDSAVPYFDGDSPDDTHQYSWTGTPHASTSVKHEHNQYFAWSGAANNSTSHMYTSRHHTSLVKGATSALLVGKDNRLNIDAPIMKRGLEDQPFTIEATIRSIKKGESNAAQQILGTASAMDGLCIAGTVLSFTTKYTNTGEARCEVDLQEHRAVTVAAVHAADRNYLMVNGDLVAEVNITPEQQADTYLAAGESLSCGATTSENLVAINGLAIFTRELDDAEHDDHWVEATDNMDEFTTAAAYQGLTFALNSSTSQPIVEYTFTTEDEFRVGRMMNVAFDEEQLVPQQVGGVSMAGLWEHIIPLPIEGSLSSITMNWQGIGETVEVSLNGEQWTTTRRAQRIPIVSDGFDPTEKVLYVRVSFPGGITNDESYFDELKINIYGPINTVAPSLETRAFTLNNGSIEEDFDITEYNENWGIELNNGSMNLSAASATTMSPGTIQIWAKKSTTGDLTDNLRESAAAWYTNDGTYSQEYQTNEWQLRTYIFGGGGHTGPITISGTGQIGCIMIFPYAMNAQQIKESYTSYTGTVVTEFATAGSMSVVDLSSLVEIYEYNWGMESAG